MDYSYVGFSRWCTRVGALAGALAVIGCGGDSTGPAGPDPRWALAWVEKMNNDEEYEVDPYYSSSTQGAIISQRTAVGSYTVRFPGLAAKSGWKQTVQVSAYGSALRRCRVVSTANNGADLVAQVQCHNSNGDLANSQFDILVVPARSTEGRSAFAISPVSGNGFAPVATSYNSAGKRIQFTRDDTGVYFVTLEGLARPDDNPNAKETFHVTAYGTGANWCKLGGWDEIWDDDGPTGDFRLRVLCFTPNGTPADAQFSFVMLDKGRPEHRLGYVWAHAQATANYTPSTAYNFNSSGTASTATRDAAGVYVITWSGLKRTGTSTAETNLVTAYGSDANYCQVGGWSFGATDGFVTIRCYAPNGTAVDSRFVAIWIE
jgi:hypothetical protein